MQIGCCLQYLTLLHLALAFNIYPICKGGMQIRFYNVHLHTYLVKVSLPICKGGMQICPIRVRNHISVGRDPREFFLYYSQNQNNCATLQGGDACRHAGVGVHGGTGKVAYIAFEIKITVPPCKGMRAGTQGCACRVAQEKLHI